MTTAVAQWGNSLAVRIPRSISSVLSLRRGDEVSIMVNERGNIEIAAAQPRHRRVVAAPGVTFDTLFAGYAGTSEDSGDAWPSDDLVGAEREAWLS